MPSCPDCGLVFNTAYNVQAHRRSGACYQPPAQSASVPPSIPLVNARPPRYTTARPPGMSQSYEYTRQAPKYSGVGVRLGTNATERDIDELLELQRSQQEEENARREKELLDQQVNLVLPARQAQLQQTQEQLKDQVMQLKLNLITQQQAQTQGQDMHLEYLKNEVSAVRETLGALARQQQIVPLHWPTDPSLPPIQDGKEHSRSKNRSKSQKLTKKHKNASGKNSKSSHSSRSKQGDVRKSGHHRHHNRRHDRDGSRGSSTEGGAECRSGGKRDVRKKRGVYSSSDSERSFLSVSDPPFSSSSSLSASSRSSPSHQQTKRFARSTGTPSRLYSKKEMRASNSPARRPNSEPPHSTGPTTAAMHEFTMGMREMMNVMRQEILYLRQGVDPAAAAEAMLPFPARSALTPGIHTLLLGSLDGVDLSIPIEDVEVCVRTYYLFKHKCGEYVLEPCGEHHFQKRTNQPLVRMSSTMILFTTPAIEFTVNKAGDMHVFALQLNYRGRLMYWATIFTRETGTWKEGLRSSPFDLAAGVQSQDNMVEGTSLCGKLEADERDILAQADELLGKGKKQQQSNNDAANVASKGKVTADNNSVSSTGISEGSDGAGTSLLPQLSPRGASSPSGLSPTAPFGVSPANLQVLLEQLAAQQQKRQQQPVEKQIKHTPRPPPPATQMPPEKPRDPSPPPMPQVQSPQPEEDPPQQQQPHPSQPSPPLMTPQPPPPTSLATPQPMKRISSIIVNSPHVHRTTSPTTASPVPQRALFPVGMYALRPALDAKGNLTVPNGYKDGKTEPTMQLATFEATAVRKNSGKPVTAASIIGLPEGASGEEGGDRKSSPEGPKKLAGHGPNKDIVGLTIDGAVGIPLDAACARVLVYLVTITPPDGSGAADQSPAGHPDLTDPQVFMREPNMIAYQTFNSNIAEPQFALKLDCHSDAHTHAVVIIEYITATKEAPISLGHCCLPVHTRTLAGNYCSRVRLGDPRRSQERAIDGTRPADRILEEQRRLTEKYTQSQLECSVDAQALRNGLTVPPKRRAEYVPMGYLIWRLDSNSAKAPFVDMPPQQPPPSQQEVYLIQSRRKIPSSTPESRGVKTQEKADELFFDSATALTDNISFMAPFSPQRGFFMKIEGIRGLRPELPDSEPAMYVVAVRIPHVKLSGKPVHFTIIPNWLSDVAAPQFKDPPIIFSDLVYNPNTVAVLTLMKLTNLAPKERNDAPRCDAIGWTLSRLFLDAPNMMRQGRFVLPWMKGEVPPHIIAELKNVTIDKVFVGNFRENKIGYLEPAATVTLAQGDPAIAVQLCDDAPGKPQIRPLLIPHRLVDNYPMVREEGTIGMSLRAQNEEKLGGGNPRQLLARVNGAVQAFFSRVGTGEL